MQRLLNFLYKYRSFLIFLILEIFSFFLIVQNNRYQSAVFFNSSNSLIAGILNLSSTVQNYFNLSKDNATLAQENALLKEELEKYKFQLGESIILHEGEDSLSNHFEIVTAQVINNSTSWRNNTLTVNKGAMDGVVPGMGVIGSGGVVGKVKYVSSRFSVITSLLHSRFTISSRIKNKVELCTSEWAGLDPGVVNIRFVPRHHSPEPGDTILTSGYNAIFPADILIGIISEVNLEDDETFYEIKAKLINDFTNLAYVHIIQNELKSEKDSIENLIEKQEL